MQHQVSNGLNGNSDLRNNNITEQSNYTSPTMPGLESTNSTTDQGSAGTGKRTRGKRPRPEPRRVQPRRSWKSCSYDSSKQEPEPGVKLRLDLDSDFKKSECKELQSSSCQYCGKLCRGTEALIEHGETHIDDGVTVCLICSNKEFIGSEELKNHLKLHLIDDPVTFTCEICKNEQYSKGGMYLHLKSHHHISGPFNCSSCGESFSKYQLFYNHRRTSCILILPNPEYSSSASPLPPAKIPYETEPAAESQHTTEAEFVSEELEHTPEAEPASELEPIPEVEPASKVEPVSELEHTPELGHTPKEEPTTEGGPRPTSELELQVIPDSTPEETRPASTSTSEPEHTPTSEFEAETEPDIYYCKFCNLKEYQSTSGLKKHIRNYHKEVNLKEVDVSSMKRPCKQAGSDHSKSPHFHSLENIISKNKDVEVEGPEIKRVKLEKDTTTEQEQTKPDHILELIPKSQARYKNGTFRCPKCPNLGLMSTEEIFYNHVCEEHVWKSVDEERKLVHAKSLNLSQRDREKLGWTHCPEAIIQGFYCPECSRVLSDKGRFLKHLKSAHPFISKMHRGFVGYMDNIGYGNKLRPVKGNQCKECYLQFPNSQLAKRHHRSHGAELLKSQKRNSLPDDSI